MASWLHDLATLIDERIQQPVVILGHSMGTILALEAWAAWPERIRGLIFVGGVPQVAPRIRERLSDRVRTLAGARDLAGWGKKVSPGVFSPATFRTPTGGRGRVRASVRDASPSVPTCVVARSCSRPTPKLSPAPSPFRAWRSPARTINTHRRNAVAEFIRQIPGPPPLEVIPDCGHLPFLEQPDAFAAVVKSFLRTC